MPVKHYAPTLSVKCKSSMSFLHLVAATPSAGHDGLCLQVLGSRPSDDRVHAGASLYTCDMCVLTY